MKRTKKSVSALIVALCMLVQLIPAFPVQMAEAADTADIVLDFYNGKGYTPEDTSLIHNPSSPNTYGFDVNGDRVDFMYLNLGQTADKNFIVSFEVKESGYYKYDPTIWASDIRASNVNFIVETPKYEDSTDRVSLLCQNAIMKYTVTQNNGGNNTPDGNYIHLFKIDKTYTEENRQINKTGDIATVTLTVNKPEDNMPYFGGYVYLTKGTNRFILKRNSNSGFYGLNKVEFTKVDNPAGNFAIDFTKKAAGTSTAYKDATLAYNGWRLNSEMYADDGVTLEAGVFNSAETSLTKSYAYMNFSTWNEVLALDILVPADGTYDVTLTAEDNINESGGTMLFSIDGKKLSAVNAAAECGEILLGGLQLTEGVHKLEIELVGSTNQYQRRYLGMKELSFESVNKATAVTEAVITSLMGATAANATVEKQGWAINKEETTESLYSALATTLKVCGIDSLLFGGEFGDTLAIDVGVPEDGTYNVSAIFQEKENMSGVFDLYVGDEYLGRVYNDPNRSGASPFTLKGFKNVTLTAGTKTFKFVRNADDMIGANSRAYFGLQSITLTPETGNEAQGITLTAPDSINVGETADVTAVMNYAKGSTDGSVVEVSAWEAYYGVNGAPAHGNQEEAAAATLSGGKLTGNKAGRLTLEARATVDGKLYTAQKHVYVNAAPATVDVPENDPNFGTAYAYVEEYKEDTYKVTFIGGVDKTEGYAKIGYEIQVDDGEVAYVESENVYEKITVNGTSHTAAEYGGSHIFIGTQGGIKAESTVTAKPYVKVPDGNGGYTTIYHGEVELTLNF